MAAIVVVNSLDYHKVKLMHSQSNVRIVHIFKLRCPYKANWGQLLPLQTERSTSTISPQNMPRVVSILSNHRWKNSQKNLFSSVFYWRVFCSFQIRKCVWQSNSQSPKSRYPIDGLVTAGWAAGRLRQAVQGGGGSRQANMLPGGGEQKGRERES